MFPIRCEFMSFTDTAMFYRNSRNFLSDCTRTQLRMFIQVLREGTTVSKGHECACVRDFEKIERRGFVDVGCTARKSIKQNV